MTSGKSIMANVQSQRNSELFATPGAENLASSLQYHDNAHCVQDPQLQHQHSFSPEDKVNHDGDGSHGRGSSYDEAAPNLTRRSKEKPPGIRAVSGGHATPKTFKDGGYKKSLVHLPFIRQPLAKDQSEEEGGAWIKEEHAASEWLNLFYDLVVVAVLTVFSAAHELALPEAIPTFLSYYVILAWCWAAQMHYDIRYQSEDAYHRLLKALQIAAFVYIGAASGNWNPGMIQDPTSLDNPTDAEYTDHAGALESFKAVVIAFIVSRVLLALQYLVWKPASPRRVELIVGSYQAHKADRYVRGVLFQAGALTISLVFSIVAVALGAGSPSLAGAKIALFYISFAVEIIATCLSLLLDINSTVPSQRIGERYGAFSLVILGEGFIGLTKSFNSAIAGLSAQDVKTYGQAFLGMCSLELADGPVIMIIVMLYLFLFGRFNPADPISARRAVVWEVIHFPLHFVLLLLLAGLVNSILTISYFHGLQFVLAAYTQTTQALVQNTSLSQGELATVNTYLNRLQLYPSWTTEFSLLQSQYNEPPENRSFDYHVLSVQYFAQVIIATQASYGIETGETLSELYNELSDVDYTWSNNVTTIEANEGQAVELLEEIAAQALAEPMSGVLWLFPCAGGVLLLSALRNMIWYQYTGVAHWLVHGAEAVAGVVLALLGLLDIGPRDFNLATGDYTVNPVYTLLSEEWPLAVVALLYFAAFFVPLAILLILRKVRGSHVFPKENELSEDEEGNAAT